MARRDRRHRDELRPASTPGRRAGATDDRPATPEPLPGDVPPVRDDGDRSAGASPAGAGRERGDARGDDFRERAGWGQGDYGYGAAHFTRTGFGYDSAGTNFAAHGQPGGFRRPTDAGRGPSGRPSDERLREEIGERLMRHPGIDPSDVAVRVAGAEVTLEGTVLDRGQKLAIEGLVDSVTGVAEVHNELQVRPGGDPAPRRRG